ncbi:hypothetical protein Pla52n_62780 [Stieleria varia]|uniref:Uncharacterized protein n=1 Tax=Stieleria varia TaxID=2528005 RepID=A0A5C5ZXN0_9BACT|nr:hypothetical protein Pla52n_62780 [Stieleria varia]
MCQWARNRANVVWWWLAIATDGGQAIGGTAFSGKMLPRIGVGGDVYGKPAEGDCIASLTARLNRDIVSPPWQAILGGLQAGSRNHTGQVGLPLFGELFLGPKAFSGSLYRS